MLTFEHHKYIFIIKGMVNVHIQNSGPLRLLVLLVSLHGNGSSGNQRKHFDTCGYHHPTTVSNRTLVYLIQEVVFSVGIHETVTD